MTTQLSFEQAPPIDVPFRFFLTAPLFALLAGLLLVWQGGDALSSRWQPATLALTHLLTTGFMLQAMCGALLQFVPVATGGNVWRPRLLAGLVHPALLFASLALAGAFLSQRPAVFTLAGTLFLGGIGLFIGVLGTALLRTPADSPTVSALRLAACGLGGTLLLGLTLIAGLQHGLPWPLPQLTDVHLAWGLGLWALGLVIGVSYLVVPMFQLTPPYPPHLSRWLAPLLLLAVLLCSLPLLPGLLPDDLPVASRLWPLLGKSGAVLGLGLGATYAFVTLRLQQQRRRKISDPTLRFFRGAMFCLLSAVPIFALQQFWAPFSAWPGSSVLLGVLWLIGVFMSIICGMLYKVVPFLNWLHLQQAASPGKAAPNMRQMIAEAAMQQQLEAHFITLVLLIAAVGWPTISRVAGAALALSAVLLWRNLAQALRIYRRHRRLPSP